MEATMSGYTRVTHRGEFFELALTTANISFATNPMTGESPEADYHARAKERFERIFADRAAFIEQRMAAFRDELAARVTFCPLDSPPGPSGKGHGPCRVNFMVRELTVDIALSSAPGAALREEMAQRLRALFVLQARLTTKDYEVTLETDALGSDDPERAQARLELNLAEARADLDAAVTLLRAEQEPKLPILPYDASLPMAALNRKQGSGGACRFGFRSDLPRGAELILTLSAAPTNEQWIDLCARLQRLQIEQLQRKNERVNSGAKPGWFSRLFKFK
jgi:hypothetical protein